jgi:hypothetical protein
MHCFVTGEQGLDGAHDSLLDAQARYYVMKDSRCPHCKEERGSKPRATMVEVQWQEWQDDLPDASGPFGDGEGTPDGLS